jgi:hypothetical protein
MLPTNIASFRQESQNQVDKLHCVARFSDMFSRKNILPLLLTGLLFISATISIYYAMAYVKTTAELRGLQLQATAIDNNRNLVRALANDAVEYSKRNPAINPILQTFGLSSTASPKATK